jgi:Holliday junction DNA helicase RuvA
LRGTLLAKELTSVEVETAGGVVYEVEIPSTVYEHLPPEGTAVELRTLQVVREDSMALYGFLEPHERDLFKRLLTASGVGAQKALAMLSTYPARRLARALAEKDIAALSQISGVGRKTAERLALELSEKVRDLALIPEGSKAASPAVEGAVSALVALGFSFTAAEKAIREAIRGTDDLTTDELIRRALSGD